MVVISKAFQTPTAQPFAEESVRVFLCLRWSWTRRVRSVAGDPPGSVVSAGARRVRTAAATPPRRHGALSNGQPLDDRLWSSAEVVSGGLARFRRGSTLGPSSDRHPAVRRLGWA